MRRARPRNSIAELGRFALFCFIVLMPLVLAPSHGLAQESRIFLPILSPQRPTVLAVRSSVPAGFQNAPVLLALSSDTPNATIYYTLDGRLPKPENLGRGTALYSEPLYIAGTSTIRAIALRADMNASPVSTWTYLFLSSALSQPQDLDTTRFPAHWGFYQEEFLSGDPVPADYAMDKNVVEDPRTSGRIAQDLLNLPSISVVLPPEELFGRDAGIYSNPLKAGRDWERRASVEFIDPQGRSWPYTQVDAGIRIAGGWSRKPDVMLKHSFSLHFRSAYGAKRLRLPLFEEGAVASFDSLRLRAGQADSMLYFPTKGSYVHDQWGRKTAQAMGHSSARSRYVHLYLNGLYWGLYDLSEEPTAAFAEDHLGGDESDYDVIKGHAIEYVEHGHRKVRAGYEVEDGNAEAFERLLALLDTDPSNADPSLLAQMESLVDLDQHAEYSLIQMYAANDDWTDKNWRAIRPRNDYGRFEFLIWDIERGVFLRDRHPGCGRPSDSTCDSWPVGDQRIRNVGNTSFSPGVMGILGWLKHFPDFRMRFADRAREQLFGEGELVESKVRKRYAELYRQVESGIVGESARWGDVVAAPRTRNENLWIWNLFANETRDGVQRVDPHFARERDRILNRAIPQRGRILIEQLCESGLYPPVAGLISEVRQTEGGAQAVHIRPDPGGCPNEATTGTIFYTLDGRDPRQANTGRPGLFWDGSPDPSALVYSDPLAVSGYMHLRARQASLQNGVWIWGPITEFRIGRPRLVISEIMYHPQAAGDESAAGPEFLELRNLENAPVDLSLARFSGITITLPTDTLLPPRGMLVLSEDSQGLRQSYGRNIQSLQYKGRLANGGEEIKLVDAQGRQLLRQSYDDEGLWPIAADGLGYSLVLRDIDSDPRPASAWRASAELGGSPGEEDPEAGIPRLEISEILANSDAPYEDAIEIYNPNLAPVDISAWQLSDDRDELGKYIFPLGSWIAPGAYRTVYEEEMRAGGAGGEGFALKSSGEAIYLRATWPDGRPSGQIYGSEFGASAPNTSLGLYTNSLGNSNYIVLEEPSFGSVQPPATLEDFRSGKGAANAAPRISPLIISEIMPAPASGSEYVELYHAGEESLDLGPDGEGWALTEAVRFRFPQGARIGHAETLLVVGDDPEKFRTDHSISEHIQIFGPYEGRLDNLGETIVLARRFEPRQPEPLIFEEIVPFNASEGWPYGPGIAMERRWLPEISLEPGAWFHHGRNGSPGWQRQTILKIHLPQLSVFEDSIK